MKHSKMKFLVLYLQKFKCYNTQGWKGGESGKNDGGWKLTFFLFPNIFLPASMYSEIQWTSLNRSLVMATRRHCQGTGSPWFWLTHLCSLFGHGFSYLSLWLMWNFEIFNTHFYNMYLLRSQCLTSWKIYDVFPRTWHDIRRLGCFILNLLIVWHLSRTNRCSTTSKKQTKMFLFIQNFTCFKLQCK